ncbi:MAG: GNAT family N-acetyltransferase [Egibacteraceae bacterium]
MTSAPPGQAEGLDEARSRLLQTKLEQGFTGSAYDAWCVLRHQQLLDALDRRQHQRFAVWPGENPVGVGYLSGNGTLVVAGDRAAGTPLAHFADGSGWRVLIGDIGPAEEIVRHASKGLLRRGPRAREQRLMATRQAVDHPPPQGWAEGTLGHLDDVAELACRLHVEDQMGPPLSRAGRQAVKSRMRDSVRSGRTWVVVRSGKVVAKVDVPLFGRRRGSQIAGVYVDEKYRGQGLATGLVTLVARRLLADGALGVTLHVRSDNGAALHSYGRAGFVDCGAWMLALR